MKHGKNPYKKQKELLAKHGYNPEEWLVERNDSEGLVAIHRVTKEKTKPLK